MMWQDMSSERKEKRSITSYEYYLTLSFLTGKGREARTPSSGRGRREARQEE